MNRQDTMRLPAAVCLILGTAGLLLSGCAGARLGRGPADRTYAEEIAFLRRNAQVFEITRGDARVAVVPKLQGRVMTCSFHPNGPSLAWVNRPAILTAGMNGIFNNYGGLDRFWLGPEGGPHALFFNANQPQDFSTWRTPPALNDGSFEVSTAGSSFIRMHRDMHIENAAGTVFRIRVERDIRVLDPDNLLYPVMGMTLPDGVHFVGFVSENRITNTGDSAWAADTGALAIRTISQFPATDDSIAIIPFTRRKQNTPIVRPVVFPDPPDNWLTIDEEAGVVLLRADSEVQAKIGLGAARARDRLASVDFDHNLLTIVMFDPTPGAKQFVHSDWGREQDDPFAGNVVNAYNNQLGAGERFYELETCSPAAFLEPGQSIAHHQRVLCFHGPMESLSAISEKVLGVALERVRHQMP